MSVNKKIRRKIREARFLSNIARYLAIGIGILYFLLYLLLKQHASTGGYLFFSDMLIGVSSYSALATACAQVLVLLPCQITIYYLDKGDLKKAEDWPLSACLMGLFFNDFCLALMGVAFLKIRSALKTLKKEQRSANP